MARRSRARRVVAGIAALAAPLTGALVAVVAPTPAVAATCTGTTPTTLTISPADAVAEVGGTHTVVVDVRCQGRVGAGDPVVIVVEGTNPRTARGVTDRNGRLTYTYDDDEGAGVDEITACTTALTPDVCARAFVTWECPDGLFASGAGCSRVPEFDLPELSDLSGFGLGGLGGFGGFGAGLAERFLDDRGDALDGGALHRSEEDSAPAPVDDVAPVEEVPAEMVMEEAPPAEEDVVVPADEGV